MNTPAHLLLGAAAFGRRGGRGVCLAAMVGALMPDLSLYVMAGTALFVMHIPARRVFDELYFSEAWQTVFAVDNSFIVWGVLLGLAFWSARPAAIAFCAAALLHLAFDFPLHHDDGRPHFWPLTGWVYESPVSYWDVRQGARYVAPVEAGLSVVSAVMLWRARLGWAMGLVVLALLALELRTVRGWMYFLVGG